MQKSLMFGLPFLCLIGTLAASTPATPQNTNPAVGTQPKELEIKSQTTQQVAEKNQPEEADYYKPTDNPAEHVKKFAQNARLKDMHQIEVDIDNDGKKEILIGTTRYDPDTDSQLESGGEFEMDIFTLNAEGKYECTKNSLAGLGDPTNTNFMLFPTDLYHQFIPELQCHGLLMFHFGKRPDDECWIEALVLNGKTWKIVPVIKGPMKTHEEQLLKRYVNPLPLKRMRLRNPNPAPTPEAPAPAPAP